MNVYVCDGERLVVSEPPLDQDDQEYTRMTLESSGTVEVTVGDRFKEDQMTARIFVSRTGNVEVAVYDEIGNAWLRYDWNVLEGVANNLRKVKK